MDSNRHDTNHSAWQSAQKAKKNMEAVGVESDGILLIVSHFNDLDKYF